jgi:uncharacterized integral membrane protein
MRLLSFIITVPFSVFLLIFAVSNPQAVELRLWPLDAVVTQPVSIAVSVLMLAAFLCGALFVALQAWALRVRYWRERRKNERLEKEITKIQSPEKSSGI